MLKDIPKNSHIKTNAILRLDFNTYYSKNPDFLTCWGCESGWVYFKMKPGTDIRQARSADARLGEAQHQG